MSVAVAVPQPSETRDICRQLTDQLPTDTTNSAEISTLRAEYDAVHNELEVKATTAKKVIEDEVVPLLGKMRDLLSQRSAERLREAGLPTWIEYYETFREKFNLKSLRTFQRQLAKESNGSDPPFPREPRKPFVTGDADLYGMLLSLLDQIDKMRDKVPVALVNTCDEIRGILKGDSAPPIVQKAPSQPSGMSDEKVRIRVNKEVKKTVVDRKQIGPLLTKPA